MNCQVNGEGDWLVAGITSWGVNLCPGTHPSVYTRVSYHRDWIDSVISPTLSLMTEE